MQVVTATCPLFMQEMTYRGTNEFGERIIETPKARWRVLRSAGPESVRRAIEYAEWEGVHRDLKHYAGAVMNDGTIIRRL